MHSAPEMTQLVSSGCLQIDLMLVYLKCDYSDCSANLRKVSVFEISFHALNSSIASYQQFWLLDLDNGIEIRNRSKLLQPEAVQYSTVNLYYDQSKTKKPTNWWCSAKRDVTHPTVTVVRNTCYHLFRKRSCMTVN